ILPGALLAGERDEPERGGALQIDEVLHDAAAGPERGQLSASSAQAFDVARDEDGGAAVGLGDALVGSAGLSAAARGPGGEDQPQAAEGPLRVARFVEVLRRVAAEERREEAQLSGWRR